MEYFAAEKDSGAGYRQRSRRQIGVVQQRGQQHPRLRRYELAADFVPREMSTLQQQYLCTASGGSDCRRRTRWASSDNDQVIHGLRFTTETSAAISTQSPPCETGNAVRF